MLALVRPGLALGTEVDLRADRALVVALDGVQDPGNAGSNHPLEAEAFGATGATLFLTGSVRISNPKLIRAAAGSLFRLPRLAKPSNREVLIAEAHQADGLYALQHAVLEMPFDLGTRRWKKPACRCRRK